MLEEHIGYLADGRRLACFKDAISEAVNPGDVVVDLGCGTGILGLMALRAGASRVYAIDRGPVTNIVYETVRREGLEDKVVIRRGSTYAVSLPERVDLLVCDHVGYFGFDYGLLRLIDDARARFLKPDGRIVPARLDIGIAPIEAEADWSKISSWQREPVPSEYAWLSRFALNSKHAVYANEAALIASPAFITSIDMHQEAPKFLKLEAHFKAGRSGTIHGLAGFFNCDLFAGHEMTNCPGAALAIRRPQAFLPLENPVAVTEGEEIIAVVTARPDEDLIAWDLRLPARRLTFRQSTLEALLFGPDDRRRLDPGHHPKLTREAEARMQILALCDGTRSAEGIAKEILHTHPDLMPDPSELRRLVSRVIDSDTR